MRSGERIGGGVRKHHAWGYSEVYIPNIEDYFTKNELEQVIRDLNSLPSDALSPQDRDLLVRCMRKRKNT